MRLTRSIASLVLPPLAATPSVGGDALDTIQTTKVEVSCISPRIVSFILP